jgi:Bor protein
MLAKKPVATLLLAGCFLILMQSCYSYHVTTARFDPSTHYNKKFVSSFFWGLLQQNVVASNCDSLKVNSLDEVHVKTNLGYAAITVITLGIWCPMTVEWKCAKPCPREGEIH